MGSKFIERHKKKSLWLLLLFFLRGRGKYILLLLIMIIFSIPFVSTSDMIERFLVFSPVRYVLKLFGLESVMASINPKYSTDILKAAFDKLKDEYTEYNPLLRAVKEEDRKGMGGLAYVRVGEMEGVGSKYGERKGKSKDKNIDFVEKENITADGVDFSEVLNKKDDNAITTDNSSSILGSNLDYSFLGLGMGNKFSGLYGSDFVSIYSNKSNSFTSSGLASFSSKSFLNSLSGKVSGKENVAINALALSQSNVPTVKDPTLKRGSVRIKKSGSVTAFGWKTTGYLKDGAGLSVQIAGSRRALFQMGETMATTSMAYKQNPAYEYQAAYVGSTYDGNSVNYNNIVATSYDTNTSLPDTGYISTVIESAQNWEQLAKQCSDAQAVHGTKISKLQDEIDDIIKTMGKPPKCCNHGAVRRWNAKVNILVQKCNEINIESKALGEKCQNTNPQIINCQQTYGKLYIKPCSKWKCWLGAILAIVGALIGFLIAGPIGALIGAVVGFAVGTMASIYFGLAMGGAAFAGAGAYFADEKSKEAIKTVEDVNKDVREGKI